MGTLLGGEKCWARLPMMVQYDVRNENGFSKEGVLCARASVAVPISLRCAEVARWKKESSKFVKEGGKERGRRAVQCD